MVPPAKHERLAHSSTRSAVLERPKYAKLFLRFLPPRSGVCSDPTWSHLFSDVVIATVRQLLLSSQVCELNLVDCENRIQRMSKVSN